MLTPRSKKQRSAITNGRRLLHSIDDPQSIHSRRYRDLYDEYLARVGANNDQLARQTATLVVRREQLDARVINGQEIDDWALIRLANSISRLLKDIERLEAHHTQSREPSLADALAR